MTREEFEYLSSPEGERLTELYLEDDPARLALAGVPACLCTRIKYLQRCREKLPAWYAARCLVPPLAYEQASSEAACGTRSYAGRLCIDLTCGLGVDAFHFSRRFDRVIAVERDEILARTAAYNFGRLGAKNITVVPDSAERFSECYKGPQADLVYIDPARRDPSARRVFLFEDCSPDLTVILPRLKRIAPRVVVKASPLFDVDEAFRRLGPCTAEVVSVEGECKELLLDLDGPPEPKLRVTLSDRSGHIRRYEFASEERGAYASDFSPADYRHVFLPDAAFYKSRTVSALLRKHYPELQAVLASENGAVFSHGLPVSPFCGRGYRIAETLPYRPKVLKKYLKDRNIQRMEILRRDFPFSSRDIAAALSVAEGGKDRFLFTAVGRNRYVLRLEPLEPACRGRSAGPDTKGKAALSQA